MNEYVRFSKNKAKNKVFTWAELWTWRQLTKTTNPNLASIAAMQHIKKKNHNDHDTVMAKSKTIKVSKLIKIHKIFLLLAESDFSKHIKNNSI